MFAWDWNSIAWLCMSLHEFDLQSYSILFYRQIKFPLNFDSYPLTQFDANIHVCVSEFVQCGYQFGYGVA